jgi:hypothetical protein
MRTNFLLAPVAALVCGFVAACFSGCSNAPGAEVTGLVRFQGTPLSGGRITFYHPNKPGRNVSANIQPDGSYRIREVPPGRVKVTVVALPARKKVPGANPRLGPKSPPPPLIPLKYTDPDTTDLVCSVSGSHQTFDIDLNP